MTKKSSSTGRTDNHSLQPTVFRTLAAYCLMAIGAGIALYLIYGYGQTLVAPFASLARPPAIAATRADIFLHVLIALAAVIITGRVLARVFRYVGQPPVIGEVVAGIILGPSLFGPEISAHILPPMVAPHLGVIAQLGILLYMFMVGLELHGGQLRHRVQATIFISSASIVLPFVLGAGLALYLYPRLSSGDVPFTSFALFMGVAMAITAFPVLARILSDRGMIRTELGVIALTCAATNDVAAWFMLAFVVAITNAEIGSGFLVAGATIAYIAVMFLLARPLLQRVVARWESGPLPQGAIAFVFVALLLSALTTEYIGIHAIFGAFLLGVVIPHSSNVAQTFTRKLEPVVTVLLLPAFFAFTGMRTQIDLVTGADQWLMCGVIILVAMVGKFGGSFLAARFTGLGWRDASALGTLMNTRGLIELIVLNVGLELGVISPTLFAMMVIMALVTTMLTAPLLHALSPAGTRSKAHSPAAADKAGA